MNLNNDIWKDPEKFDPVTAAGLVDCMTFSVKEMLRRASVAEEENGGPLDAKNNAYLYGCFCGLLIAGDTAEEMVKETPEEELPESVKSVLADYEELVDYLTAPGMPWEEQGQKRKKAAEHLTARREGREEDLEDLEYLEEEDLEDQLEDLLADGDRKDAEEGKTVFATPEQWKIINEVADKQTPEALAAFLQLLADIMNGEEEGE